MDNINSNQDSKEYNMDTWNNAIGREIRLEVRNEIKGKNNPYEVPENKVYTFEGISKMKPEEFRSQQDRILSDFVQRKIVQESEAKEKVQSGELIYVQSYKRTDGTDIKGYYRRR